jgi:hypothetical protein
MKLLDSIIDGHTWTCRRRKDNKTGVYNHRYVKVGKYIEACIYCPTKRRWMFEPAKNRTSDAYLVNGEWVFKRPQCVRAIALTAI